MTWFENDSIKMLIEFCEFWEEILYYKRYGTDRRYFVILNKCLLRGYNETFPQFEGNPTKVKDVLDFFHKLFEKVLKENNER
jgi:hypothetical protein